MLQTFRLYYPYWQYTDLFIFRFVSLLCQRRTLRLCSQLAFSFVIFLSALVKIDTPGVHVSTARESEMCYSLGASVGDVTRLNVANVVRFSLYVQLIWKFFIVDIFLTIMRKVELVVKGRTLPFITNEGGLIRSYLQRWELNINDSVRKYYNRSVYLTGSWSNSNNIITKKHACF